MILRSLGLVLWVKRHLPSPASELASGDVEPVALVMDLGGTWMRAALAIRGGDLLWKARVPSNSHEGREAVIARAESLLNRGISEVGNREIVGIGMAVAGPVNFATGTMYSPPQIPFLDGVSFKSVLETGGVRPPGVEWPILVDNDATLAALGEYTYGSGVGARTLVYITISTGIGGGVVMDGRPLRGAHGMAGELGHMSVDRNGPLCKCGHIGCLEAFASGTAIADAARRYVEEGGASLMGDMVSGDSSRMSAETVFAAAARDDPAAKEILEDVSQALGAGLVNILHIFNPDIIVIGGGVSGNWDYLLPRVQTYIQAHAMSHVLKLGYKLVVSSLGDDIGLVGAAALVWQESSAQTRE